VVPVNIANANEARLVIYRTKEQGLHWWRYELCVNRGEDLYTVSAFLNARAGSEVLDKDYPAQKTLQKSLMSFAVHATAATQATTAPVPATKPASP
jgi:hypothetical protein